MKKLKSIEIHDCPDGKAMIQGVYVERGETRYSDSQNELTRDDLIPEPVPYWFAKSYAKRLSNAAGVGLTDYIAMNSGVPLVESLALMKGE